MEFSLVDDGTLDTVFECSECRSHERFNYETSTEYDEGMDYLSFLDVCRELLLSEHTCAPTIPVIR